MNQILILTRNILAEQETQRKLQVLNYEVYCSSNLFEWCKEQQQTTSLFKFFQYIIVSETICELEVRQIVKLLEEYPVNIIRKVEENVTTIDQNYFETNQINAIISTRDSIDELRECLHQLNPSDSAYPAEKHQLSSKITKISSRATKGLSVVEQERNDLSEVLLRLTQTETRILFILIKAEGKTVNRDDICHEIWQDGVSNSHKASLSSTVSRMKLKFDQINLTEDAIRTVWGKGYCLNRELLERINKDNYFSGILSISQEHQDTLTMEQ